MKAHLSRMRQPITAQGRDFGNAEKAPHMKVINERKTGQLSETDKIPSDKMTHVALNLRQSFLAEIFTRITRSAPEDLVLPDLDSSEGAGCDESGVGDGGIDPTPLLWWECKAFSWNYWEFPSFFPETNGNWSEMEN